MKIPEFAVKITHGRREITFSLKSSTSFPLGAIKQFISKQARTSNVVLEAMNFLNQLFSCYPTKYLIPVGRKFFTRQGDDIKPFEIIEFRRGLFQAVHFGGSLSPTINIDITTGVFWNSDLVTALDLAVRDLNLQQPTDLNVSRITQEQMYRLSRLLKGLKFHVKHRGAAFAKRQHTITKVVKQSARTHRFQMNDDEAATVSVEQYMKKTYNIKLRYPEVVLALKGDSTYMPLELCHIVAVSPNFRESDNSVNASLERLMRNKHKR